MHGTLNRIRGRSAQDFVSRNCTTIACMSRALPTGGALPYPGYHPLQGLDNLHSDGGGCNTARPECFSPMTLLGANLDYDGGFCFQM